jgi:hypothetical protein
LTVEADGDDVSRSPAEPLISWSPSWPTWPQARGVLGTGARRAHHPAGGRPDERVSTVSGPDAPHCCAASGGDLGHDTSSVLVTILVARVRCSRVNGVLKPQVGEQTPAARCARLIAVAAPIPWFAPVTIATCPRSTIMRLGPFTSAKKASPPFLSAPLATSPSRRSLYQSGATCMSMSHVDGDALSGGKISAVARVGDTVVRSRNPNSTFLSISRCLAVEGQTGPRR